MPIKVFLSYAKEDHESALKYYELLLADGAAPWMDVKHLLPGQNWEVEIERAFSDANVVILLLSKTSVNKRGFVQREANDAIERLRYKRPTDIYVIPLLLEPCDVPSYIAGRLQYVDLTTPGAWDQVRASLKLAAQQQSIELMDGVSNGPFRVFSEKLEEQWQGAPGHDISIEYPRFEWSARQEVAKELSQLFAGRAYEALLKSRQKSWDQLPNLFPEINGIRAMNGRWDDFGVVHATEGLLSLAYEVSCYEAGAAHPNLYFETFNFAFNERLQILSLPDFFTSEADALKSISKLCIDQLCREYWSRVGQKPDEGQMKWFAEGAGESGDNFKAFTVSKDNFTFLFSPYQVGPYALGRWSVDVSFYDLLKFLRSDGPHMLAASESE